MSCKVWMVFLICFAGVVWADPKVVLEENFNDGGSTLAKHLLANKYISLAPKAGPDGSDAIRVTYEGDNRGGKRVTGGHPLNASLTEACLSFDVKFDKDFQWVLGGKLHGLGPDHKVTGGRNKRPDGWSARLMFGGKGFCSTYLYDQNKNHKYGIGKKTTKPVFTLDKWHHIVLHVKVNDPGKANGFAHAYIDKKLVIKSDSIIFRAVDGEKTLIRKFLFSTFHGGSSPKWAPVDKSGKPTSVYAFFDNFKVTNGKN